MVLMITLVLESGSHAKFYTSVVQAEAPKKKVKKINVNVSEVVYGALSPADVQKAVEKEFEMALQDRVMEETKDRKNAVEAYVYEMRNKACGIFFECDVQCCPVISCCTHLMFVTLASSVLQLTDKYHDFVTPMEKEEFIARLQDVEDWLYEEGEDEIKSVYTAKLDELKKVRFLRFLILFRVGSVNFFLMT